MMRVRSTPTTFPANVLRVLTLLYAPVLYTYRYKIVDGKEKGIEDERMFVIPTTKNESQVNPYNAERGECLVRAHLLLLSI